MCLVAIPFAPAAPVPTHLLPKDPPLFQPIRKGAEWVYEGGGRTFTLSVTATERDEKSEATVITISQPLKGGKEVRVQKLAVSRRGILWLENSSGSYDTPYWLLKAPVRPKEEWAFTTSGPGIANAKGTMTVAGVEDVQVPAGKFSAVRVEQKVTVIGTGGVPDFDFSQTFWYAPDVGLVKWVCGEAGSVLKEFTPGP